MFVLVLSPPLMFVLVLSQQLDFQRVIVSFIIGVVLLDL